jgi:hypothetical protein
VLAEILIVFAVGLLLGQLLARSGVKPGLSLSFLTAASAAALVFALGLSIGSARSELVGLLPAVGTTSLLIGALAALTSAAAAYIIRGRRRD